MAISTESLLVQTGHVHLYKGFIKSQVALVAAFGLTVLISTAVIADRSDERRISFFNIHTEETLDIVYMRDGKRLPEAMEKINWIMRDWRQNSPTKMDPELIDTLWEIHAELGSREPIHLISGYRSKKTNNMLRKTRGGQAKKSQHILGKAADVHFPDVPIKQLRYSALIRERGGVGYYPTSALPFVHVDTGRVRHWPRMPRYELALLFPNGKTKHRPSSGGRITKYDVKIAQKKHKSLATQVATFFDLRNQPRAPKPTLVARAPIPSPAPTQWRTDVQLERDRGPPALAKKKKEGIRVASLAPMAPRLKLSAQPRLAERPSKFTDRKPPKNMTSFFDRAGLTDLFTFASFFGTTKKTAEEIPATGSVAAVSNAGGNPIDTLAKSQPTRMAALGGPMPRKKNMGPPLSDSITQTTSKPRAPEPQVESKTLESEDRFGWGTGFVSAPAYDDEHPDELYYRPFALAPLLTASPSPDDPVLAKMVHPDVAATLEFVDDNVSALPMKLRPGRQHAALLWAQQFSGSGAANDGRPTAIATGTDTSATSPAGLKRRLVRTSMR